MTKYVKLAILLILATAIITACGNGDNPGITETTDNNLPAPDPIILDNQPPPANPLFLNTAPINLTIRTRDTFSPLIWAVEEEMQELFAEHGIDFRVTVTDHDGFVGGQIYQNDLLRPALAAGSGYDIVFLNTLPLNLRPFADSGSLLNIYDLIDQDPSRTRDDFFTNVLTALEHRGGLYMLPLTFGFEFMGINANLPDSIVNDFMQKSGISWRQAMQIAATIQNEYPEVYASFPYTSNLTEFHMPTTMLQRVMPNFIDFSNSESFFDGAEFIEFANLMQATISPPENLQEILQPVILFNFETPGGITQVVERHMLLGASGSSSIGFGVTNFTPLIPLFGLENDAFLNFVPVTDDNGNLVVDISAIWDTWANVVFPAGDNSAVAWEFVMRMLQRMLRLETSAPEIFGLSFGNASLAIPILRNELESHFNRVIEQYAWWRWANPTFVSLNELNFAEALESIDEIIDAAAGGLARLTELANRPIVFADRTPFDVWRNGDIVGLFMAGEISAEELGQKAQERTTLWLAGEWEN
ncbi:MAG: hypothetical protein FWG68_03925 [Defluviitaleaceae bacterium]|nr:hypothetical protein [Defluviitaleaceae bacterium]